MITLTEQVECAQQVLAQMRRNQSRWLAAQEAIVATLQRQVLLEEVSNAIKGRPTQPVELA